ncbi:unnamed protein product [Aphis gossypii]|uniref:Uncharacterized protein n=1 Tax=Aphis gossypii TaxID=80765 RepID=A0A9P0NBT9_APHGO|nr:unnamed protein product [Aphis gossypii]
MARRVIADFWQNGARSLGRRCTIRSPSLSVPVSGAAAFSNSSRTCVRPVATLLKVPTHCSIKFHCLGSGGKIVSGLILTLPPPPPLQWVGTFTPSTVVGVLRAETPLARRVLSRYTTPRNIVRPARGRPRRRDHRPEGLFLKLIENNDH